jgi:hypothetical protein
MRWAVYVGLAYHPLFTTWSEEVAEETPTIAAEI